VAATFKYERLDDFLAAMGYGDIHPHQVAMRLSNELKQHQEQDEAPALRPASAPSSSSVKVLGVGDLLTRIAQCCNPVPGDEIIGYITRGKGVTVHRQTCPNVVNEQDQERLVQVDWGRTGQHMFPITIRVEAWDRVGLARDVAALLADEGLSMTAQTAVVHKDQTATVWATVEVSGLDKLSRVLYRLEGVKDVFSVMREVGKGPNGKA
jgi:GTP pyrophosphokinase